MGGKKKKSLANKLSKMSDEERARYLQHRMEMEEEAKRRKEQLIATFMKKKIKKEDAFARLNISKINQNWHQILRKIKVKEMKVEIDHLRRWIGRVMDYKNRRISKLMDELEEAEEQYLNNFKSLSMHMDRIIEDQNEYIEKLQSRYQKELDELIAQAKKEQEAILDHANSEEAYLKTVIFGQETKALRELRNSWEYYSMQLYEIEQNNHIKLRQIRVTRGETESALWRQMLQIIRSYVQKTDVRRCHLQELKRRDEVSASEICRNEERINKDEEIIKILSSHYDDLLEFNKERIKSFEIEEKQLNEEILKIRTSLKTNLALDERQLRILTSISSGALDHLSGLLNKGNQIMMLSKSCQKYENEREKSSKWMPSVSINELSTDEDSVLKIEDTSKKCREKISDLTDDGKLYQKALDRGFRQSKIENDIGEDLMKQQKSRPKSSLPARLRKSATNGINLAENISTPERIQIAFIEKVQIESKKVDEDIEEDISPSDSPHEFSSRINTSFLDKCYESLEKVEKFWVTYNKVGIDVKDLKKEKIFLEKENKQLRGLIRAVLEAAALEKSIPDSQISTRVPSKRRSNSSAPLRRIVFN